MTTYVLSPMTLPTEVADSAPGQVEVVGWGVFEGLLSAHPGLELPIAWCEQRRFKAKIGERLVIAAEGGRAEVLLGLGDSGLLDTAALRRAGGSLSLATGDAKKVAIDLTGIPGAGVAAEQAVQAAIEGFWGARYRYTRYRPGDPDPLESLTVVVASRGGRRSRAWPRAGSGDSGRDTARQRSLERSRGRPHPSSAC